MSVIAIPWKTKTKIMINNNHTLSSTYNKRIKLLKISHIVHKMSNQNFAYYYVVKIYPDFKILIKVTIKFHLSNHGSLTRNASVFDVLD